MRASELQKIKETGGQKYTLGLRQTEACVKYQIKWLIAFYGDVTMENSFQCQAKKKVMLLSISINIFSVKQNIWTKTDTCTNNTDSSEDECAVTEDATGQIPHL